MSRVSIAGQPLAALFLFGCVPLNFQLLFLFNKKGRVLSTPPLLNLYIFGVWICLIGSIAYVIERAGD